MKPTATQISLFLRNALGGIQEIFVDYPREDKKGEYEYAIFLSAKAFKDYHSIGKYDSEDIVIFETEGFLQRSPRYSFAVEVTDPGVYMHKDGSGTPPSSELVDYNKTFKNYPDLLKELAEFIFKRNLSVAMEELKFIEHEQ